MKNLTYILIFMCNISIVLAQHKEKTIVIMDSISIELPEIYVNSEYPIMKISDNALIFDIPHLIKDKPVNTTFEVLRELPGVSTDGDNVNIIGTSSTNIILNGHKSTMSLSQIINILKSTSANNVKSIEVMYSTPPQYGVKGASLNIVMKRKFEDTMALDIQLTGKQAYYFSPTGMANFTLSRKKYTFILSYSPNYKQSRAKEELDSNPYINEQAYTVEQNNGTKSQSFNHQINADLFFDFSEKRRLDLSYSSQIADKNTNRWSFTNFVGMQKAHTNSKLTGPSNLQNTRIGYQLSKGLNLSIDYTYYKNKNLQDMQNEYTDYNEGIRINNEQKVHRSNISINHERSIRNNWKLNMGANFEFSLIDNSSFTYLNNIGDKDATFKQRETEYIDGIYLGVSKDFARKLLFNASLNIEYSKAEIDSIGQKSELWSEINLYPNISLMYNINSSNMLQLMVSSNKIYPAYWSMSSNLTYLNPYTQIKGNPYLKPERSYSTRINYILKRKYIFGAFVNNHKNYLRQQYYQSITDLKSYYQYINIEKHNTYGLMAVLPFNLGRIMSSRFITTGFLIHDVGKLVDIPFDRKKLFGQFMLLNTFTFPQYKQLIFELNGTYSTASIQGVYDINYTYNLTGGIIWKMLGDKLSFTLRGEDLLNGLAPRLSIKVSTQECKMKLFQDTRSISLTVRYILGKSKKKSDKEIDSSRLGF